MRHLGVFTALLFTLSGPAFADDAGSDAQTSDDSGSVPLACEGGLCDTTNQSSCTVGKADASPSLAPIFAVAFLIGARRRRRVAGIIACVALARSAGAETKPVDVVVKDPPPERRWVTIEWNPLPLLTIGKVSGNVVFVPIDHHGIVLSPFYAWAKTAPIWIADDNGAMTQLPEQRFTGFGAEIGYRYYTGLRGPRGFFVGPSFILGFFTASPMSGTDTHFLDVGGAVDAGYQALITDRVSLGLGVGLQFIGQDKTIPSQQFPAKIYANTGVLPRLLLSIGVAL